MSEQDVAKLRPSPYRERRMVVIVIAILAIITGLFETATIVAIVAFIEGVTSGNLNWEVTTGPLDLAISRPQLALIAGLSLAGMTAGQLISVWMKARAVTGWQLQTQQRAIRAYLGASWATQSGQTSGSLQVLMNRSGAAAQGLQGLMSLLSAAGAVLIFSLGAFVASPLAAGVLLTTGALLMIALRPVRSASRKATEIAVVIGGHVADEIGQVHDLAQEIQVHHAGASVEDNLRANLRVARQARRRAALLSGAGGVLYRSIGLGFVLVAAVLASRQADLDVARVGVAGLLLLRSLSYGQSMQSAWQTIENNKPYVDKVGDAIEMYESSTPVRGNTAVAELGRLRLDGVSYSYDDEAPALNDIAVTIEPGETLGVVGPSGGGKSTLAQILLGLREPSAGSYLAGAIPTMSISGKDWFRKVTVVPQQPRLLRASVTENIIFYRNWISPERALEAATAAGLHEEIMALADGYDTIIGDAVRDLSGGQRQRLGIARALAGDPQLLVLDEPTSALDAMSESRVQETLAGLKGNVTVVIIAHRLATLNSCDRLLVLEAGEVRALDTPSMVLEQNDFYRTAVQMQLVDAGEPGS